MTKKREDAVKPPSIRTMKQIWGLFGGLNEYERQAARQEKLFNEMGEISGEGPRALRSRKRKFLKVLSNLDTQKKRADNIASLEEIADLAHSFVVEDKAGVTPGQKLRWARIEAYTRQVINSLLKAYDAAYIKAAIKELRQMIEHERKRTRPT